MAKIITLNDIIQKLDILTHAVLTQKQMLDIDEAAMFTNMAKSYLYKLTSAQEIPHYKPRGGMIYFDRSELEGWLRQGRVNTNKNIADQAAAHVAKAAV
jgi:excisionase family DNA binding protein